MRPGIARLFVAIVVLGCGGATCLYSGAGPIEGGGPAMRGTWNPALAFIADLLTVPIPTSGIADVRDVALLVCAGVVLILAGTMRSGSSARSSATRWMAGCASAVIVLAAISAWAWRSFDLSWGWIIRFAAGAALAIVISHRFTPAMVRQTMAGLLVVAVLALALSIWHRADRGYAHFSWPIGPITIVGGLAAVWAALAGVWGVGLVIGRAVKIWATTALGACALILYGLQQTERRSPVMGLIAAIVLVGVISVWRRYPNRGVRVAVVAALVAMTAGGAGYVVRQARSPDRETSGPIAVRKAYWEQSAKFIGANPFLGIGPDRFVIEMTIAIAPLRAEMPHVYHGNLDTAAHNEWLQAAVELGLPAGLAYAALPLGVLFLTLRSRFKSRPTQRDGEIEHIREATDDHESRQARIVVSALAAAIISLVVCEAASINLRGPILPTWYWTFLGLLAATSRPVTQEPATIAARPSTNRLRPILLVAGGVVCLALSFSESLASAEEARSVFPPTGWPPSRVFFERTLSGRYAAAVHAIKTAGATTKPENFSRASDLWRGLFELLPVYRETATQYADSLVMRDQPDEAKRALESVISTGTNPYDVSANVLYAWLLAGDPVAQLRCLQRALRSGSVSDLPEEILDQCLNTPSVQMIFEKELPLVREVEECKDNELFRGAKIELLRIHALRSERNNRRFAAIESQQSVAHCYRHLERTNNPYRRAHEAETDAFYTLAKLFSESDRANDPAAFFAIVEAERYAVLGIKHEKVRHPDPSMGFIGGEVVPTEFPERLRSLWELSAWLHLAAGNFQNVDLRILASLPPDRWNAEGLKNQKILMAAQVYTFLRLLPAGNQPPYLDQLREMGREAIEDKNAIFHDGRS